MSASKLTRRRAKKATTVVAVGHGLDFLFMLPKLSLGQGYEFWELQEPERAKMAEALVECMEALPKGDDSAFAKFVAAGVKFISDVAPFVGLAGVTYASVAWRVTLTKQMRASQNAGAGNVRTDGEVSGSGSGAGGTAHANGSPAKGAVNARGAERSDGSGLANAAFSNVADVFGAAPDFGITGDGRHIS